MDLKQLWIVVAVTALAPWIVGAIEDALQFRRLVAGEYETPWYSSSWMRQPYTNAQLSFLPGREYWTTNAIKSERWLVREVQVGRVVFWTVLERLPANA